MHCSASSEDKANEMFRILQEEGLEKHKHISAGDKDKMCEFATIDVFAFSLRAGMITKAVYT